MSNTKRNKHLGGGAEHKNPLFKPLVATSLALALGVSVAVAQTTVSYGTQGITSSGNVSNPTTTTDLVLTSGVKNITIAFTKDNSGLSTSTSGDTMTIQGGGRIQTSILPVIQIKSDTGINLGDGLLKMDFGTANYATDNGTKSRYTILDLSAVKTGIAFQGNIELGTGSAATSAGWANENRFLSTFGGEGMQGNITIKPTCDGDGMRSDFAFLNDANLQGNLNVSGGTNYITFGTGDINGNIISSGGTTYITYGQGSKGLLSNGTLDARRGTLGYRFGENVSGSSRIFTLDTSASSDGNSRVSVSGGSLVFDGVKQVILKNGDTDTNGGEGTITLAPKTITWDNGSSTTYSGGSLQFNLDASALPDTSNPVVKGNISVTSGTLIFKEKSPTSGSNPFENASALEPSKTYYVDGNVTINNGGISIFWDDSRGFTAKLATTEGHNLTQTGGMIGKNDAWFAKGTFVEGQNKISLIQNYRSLSHLVFEDAIIIGEESNSAGTNVIDSQAAQGGTYGLQALFKEDATINGRINASFGQGNSAYNGARNTLIFAKRATVGSILTGAYSKNTITFKGDTTIKGVIETATSHAGGSGIAVIDFLGTNNSIGGNITATYNGSNTITFKETSATNSISGVSTNNNGTNNITFNGTTSNTISGNINVNTGTNNITFNGSDLNTISGNITANLGKNRILFNQGNNTISGNILINNKKTAQGTSNYLSLSGTSATLGEASQQISIKIENSTGDGNLWRSYGNNTLLFNANTSTLHISQMSVSGDGGNSFNPIPYTFNALSFNNASDSGSRNIGTLSASSGSNIIGKDLTTQANGYNNIMFGNTNNPSITNNFLAEFQKDTHTASGSFTFGTITANGGGTNYINAWNITITTGLNASGGNNYIYAGSTTGTNSENTISGNVSSTSGKNVIKANILVFNGNSITAGSGGSIAKNVFDISEKTTFSNTALVIKTDNTTNQNNDKHNIFKFNGTVIGNIGELTAVTGNSNLSKTKNILSFDSSISSSLIIGDINKDPITASGYNYIGKNLTSGSGSSLDLSFNENNWSSSTYNANLALTVTNTIQAKYGKNFINVGSLSVGGAIDGNGGINNIATASDFSSGAIKARWSGSNNIFIGGNGTIASISAGDSSDNSNVSNNITFFGTDSQSVVEGNISIGNGTGTRQNNITLSGNNATLTLKGQTNQITNFTAYATPNNARATGYSTLVIDGTTQANNTTISNVTNGENLVVKFNGRGDGKSATLKISSFTNNANTLKAITLGDASTYNTLDLTALNTIAITDAVSVGANQGLNLNLLNTTLTLTGGLTTTGNGASVINVGDTTTASASSTLLGGAINLATLNLNGATDSSTSALTLSNDSDSNNSNVIGTLNANAKTNTLQVTKGTTTIKNAISVGADKTLTLSLRTSTDTPHNTLVELESAIGGEGSKNIAFTGGINPADQIHHATLLLKATDNQITSVSSSASNGVIAFQDTAGATIGSVTISSIAPSTPSDPSAPSTLSTSTTGGSLTFAFRGAGASQVTTSGITVGNGATLGISLGVTDASTQTISGNIDFQEGSTLLVDFLDGNKGNATITANMTAGNGNSRGGSGITIGTGRNSIINFHGANEGQLNGDGITIAGGNNTINFIGSATMSGVTLESGTNTINVYGAKNQESAITGTIISSELGSINNTINLNDYSILNLLSAENGAEGSGELKTTATNTLNFLGDNATLKGGFGSNGGGTATVNVGRDGGADTDSVSGTIIGQVSNATLAFNAGTSKLTLQNLGNGEINHTFATITSNAKDGILVFDTTNGVVNATISNGTTINEGKSLSLDFQGKNNTTVATNGVLTIDGTLGIIINGDGEKKVTSDINLNGKGTLLVDFTSGTANVTLGQGNGITIAGGESSIINFRGGKGVLANSLTLNGGTNTLNFFVNGNVGGIKLVSGSNNINVEDGITATILDTSSVGSVNNTINLKEGAKLYLQADGSGSLNTTDGTGADEAKVALSNILNFNGAYATLYGGFGVVDGATSTASINVKNTGAKITGNVTNANVNFSDVNGSTLTLQGATNTLNALGSSENITGTIILDANNQENGVSAEITTAVQSTSSVGLKFGSGNNAKTFKFSANNNNLAGVEFDDRGSTNNMLSFTSTGNSIVSPFEISNNQELIIDLQNGSDLSIAGLGSIGSGVANLQSTETTTLKGGDVNVAKLSLLGTNANAKMQNSNTTINSLLANGTTSNTLTLDGANSTNNSVSVRINSIAGNLTAILNGADGKSATLNMNGNATLSALKIGDSAGTANSTNNTLAINNGKTIISSDVSVGASQGISFNLANGATLEFGGSNTFANSAGNATFSIQGANTTLNGAINASGGTTTLSMSDGSSLTLTDSLSTTAGTTTIRLTGTSSITGDISTATCGTTALNYTANNTTLTLKNGDQTISTLSLANNTTSTLNLLSQARTTIGNALTLGDSKNLNINIDGNSSLVLTGLVTTSSGALNVNANGSLNGTLTLAGLTNETGVVNNTINVSTLKLGGNLSVNQGATNTIRANSITLSGNVITKNQTNATKNTIVANSIEFAGSSSVYTGHTGGKETANLFDISGDTKFSNNNLTIITNNNYADNGEQKLTLFKFGGKVSGSIAELTSTSRKDNNDDISKTKSVLSFESSAPQSLTITNINKANTIENQFTNDTDAKKYTNGSSGYVYIGKNLTLGSGESLVLSFDEGQWSSNNYTANLDLTITNTIQAKYGQNFINVTTLRAGTIYGNAGTNNIATGGNLTATTIQAYWGGTNNIIIGGDASIGNIQASYQATDYGTNNITFSGSNSQSIVKGNIVVNGNNGKNNLTLSGSGATLTLEGKDSGGTTHAITTLTASGVNTTLVLDNSKVTSGAMTTTIGTLSNGANLTATLKGGGEDKNIANSATLVLNGGALKALTLGEGSTGNILDLSNATSMSITNQVNVGNGQDLKIKLKNTTLALKGGLSTDGGTSTLELVADDSGASSATLTGGAIALSNLTLGVTSNTLTLNNAKTTFTSALNVTDDKTLALNLGDRSTLVLGSSTNTITSLTSNGGLVDLSQGVKLAEDTSGSDSLAQAPAPVLLARGLVREGDESEVVTTPDTSLPPVVDNAPSVDDNVSQEPSTPSKPITSKEARNTLTINDGFTGTATFKLYANSSTADRVVFKTPTPEATPPAQEGSDPVEGASLKTTPTGTAIIAITGDGSVYDIKFDENGSDNIMVADTTGANGTVAVEGGESMIGVSTAVVNLIEKNGQYYIGDVVEGELNQSLQAVASSALAVNYDLYLANFNSLNKRMGELRNNEDSNGVWARVFGGNMSNSFGAGSKTDYITAQAGYDYSLSVGNDARNFTGIALAYGSSNTKSNTLGINAIGTPFANIALDKVSSNMVEVGVYNSYVADSGWYNDTILKFDYIMSEFSLSNDPSTMSKTNNFAMVLSDEFGYRYSFGVSEKGSWYIDPQAEFAFGYFNQSDFNRAVLNSDKVPASLQASQDAILTLRSRIGATLGKKFITDKGFASLYVGASYEYDYIEGGNSEAGSGSGRVVTQLDKVESNGRAVLNVGSNIELTKGARLYIDVEKSFGDKQRTFMQFNLGARYSF